MWSPSGGILSPFLFAVYVDVLIENLRQSGYGIFIGNNFVGCLMYADDIVLLSGTCSGLQCLVNICTDYCSVWNIKLNERKSQVSTFGGHCPQFFNIVINNTPLIWTSKIKYLGCTFVSRTGLVDPKQPTGKFYGSVNNILSVLGHNRNEMMAVHLVKTYCLPALLYSCEVWSLKDTDLHGIKVAWNNSFRKIFNACWRESVNVLLYYCNEMPLHYIIDMRKLLFYKKLLRTDNSILSMLFNLKRNDVISLCAKYSVNLSCNSASVIKARVWNSFVNSVASFLQ